MTPVLLDAAVAYLEPIVQYLDIPVYVNDRVLSMKPFPSSRRDGSETAIITEGSLVAELAITADASGRAAVDILGMTSNGARLEQARGHLAMNGGPVATYQHGFMLARVPVASIFQLGGSIDCPILRPTAGREALVNESHAVVQACVTAADRAVAECIAKQPDLADRFSALFNFIVARGRYDLATNATIRRYGTDARMGLGAVKEASGSREVYFCQEKHDRAIMETFRGQGKLIVQLSTESKRQQVERQFLLHYCRAKQLADRVQCLRALDDSELSFNQASFLVKLKEKLRYQYFVEGIGVQAGSLSHQAMFWAPPKSPGIGMMLFVDVQHPQIRRIMDFRSSLAYESVFDVFLRDSVFPHLEGAFPELRTRDFDLMLKRLQSTMEYWQIDPNDVERLQLLATVTGVPPEEVAVALGASQPGRPAGSVVSRSEVVTVGQVVEAPAEAEVSEDGVARQREELLTRLATAETKAKILDATTLDPRFGLTGYYMAMTPDAHVLYRRVLERRPLTDFFWGGYRSGFALYEEGSCVVYYDIELPVLIEPAFLPEEQRRAGTLRISRDPVLSKNMVFLPIPDGFEGYFVPTESTLRFTIRHQILGAAAIEGEHNVRLASSS